MSRAYYAAFHYARALLLLKGLEPKTHRGVVSLLLEHYEKPGLLEPGAVSVLARLQTFRGLADYDASGRLPKRARPIFRPRHPRPRRGMPPVHNRTPIEM